MRLFFIILCFLLASCATSTIDIYKGTFQAVKPPNIYGNNRYLTKDTNYTVSFEANTGKNKTIPLPGVYNNDSLPANINYRLIENTLGYQFYKTIKKEDDFYTGFGLGIQNFPYALLSFGHNQKFFEAGGIAFLGLVLNKASYEGWWYYHRDYIIGSDDEYSRYVKFNSMEDLHLYGGFVAHASLFLEKFVLNYAASISNPWLVDELFISESYEKVITKYGDISFYFPILIMQDIGISYTANKITYRLGINQITGVKFPGQHWGMSVQVAYVF